MLVSAVVLKSVSLCHLENMEFFVDVREICKEHFEPLFVCSFSPSGSQEEDLCNLKYHITVAIVKHFSNEYHIDKLVHPWIRPFLETSGEMGSFVYDHVRLTIGFNDNVLITNPIEQLTAMKEEGKDVFATFEEEWEPDAYSSDGGDTDILSD